ncbi:MAG: M6 family metalloprotease domain-containing protein [Aggregatilineales bacterium]
MRLLSWRWPLFLIAFTAALAAVALRPPAASELPAAPPTRVVLADMPAVSASPTAVPTSTPALPPTEQPTATPTDRPTLARPSPAPTTTPSVSAAPPASEPVRLVVPQEPVPGQAVITFAPDASPAERAAYLDSVGATVQGEIDSLGAVIVSLPPEIAAAPLPPSPAVAASEPDYFVTALQSAPAQDPLYPQQWALPVIGAPAGWAALPPDAAPVAVAVIDSGVCADHPDLAGRVLPGWDFVENDADPQDLFGHGCAVASVIAAAHDGAGMAGVAPHARILPLRVLDAQGVGTYSNVAAAITMAADLGASVINLSLGGANPSTVMQNAVEYAVARGATLIAAAGNTGGSVLYPAAFAPVVAVASVDQNLQRSSFSSHGPEIDLYAPGRDILAAQLRGGYAALSGTSFAAPQAAGVAALELALGRQLALTGGVVAVGGGTNVAIQPTPTDPAEPDLPVPDSEWPGGRRPPLRVMVPHPDVAAQMQAEATSLGQMFPQMVSTGGLEPGPRMVFPQSQTFRVLALLVEFSDLPRDNSIPVTSFDTLLFSATPPSIRHYYREVSYNQLDIVSVTLPSAIGWRTAPQPLSYYVNNNYCTGAWTFPYGYPNNCQRLVEDLVYAVNPVVDFSQYDNNGDGWVDALIVIHAGQGAEVTNQPSDIWSHQWSVRYPPLVDGVRVGIYTMQPEYIYTPGDLTIGVLAHELGHALGLPDLYDIDYSSYGVGNWSLMSGGAWNGWNGDYAGSSPAHLDAWSKAWLGFTTPTVLTTTQVITLPAAVSSPVVYRLDTSRPGEYFLVENRQKIGYDSYLPGAGLLIWHVDEGVSGSNRLECRQHDNWRCGANHFRVALEQADGALDLEFNRNLGDASDPYWSIRDFSPATLPNTSSYYTSAPQLFGLFDISNPGMTMNALFRVIVPVPILSAPADGASVVTHQPTLTWLPVPRAASYDVQIHRIDATVVTPVRVNATSYTVPLIDVDVIHYWRVRAVDAAGNASDWSETRSVRAVSPPNVAPERNVFTTDQPQLTWGRVTGALAYQVQVARNPAFADAATYNAGSALALTVNTLDEGLYYWRVRAQLASGAWGPWSAADVFVVNLP